MSSFRARMRVAVLVAAIPALVAAGPLANAPAVAVDSVRQADIVDTLGDKRIGPRAGFRGDVARGIEGHTAIVAFDASPSATVQRATVVIDLGSNFALYDHFNDVDGFQLFKDANGNDRLDAAEHAAGPVSHPRYDLSFPGGGKVAVTVNADQTKATGAGTYLLTAHPSATISDERVVKFTVPANGVVTTAGTIPAAPVALSDIVIDSRAPSAIPLTNFVPVGRAPEDTCPTPAPAAGCGEDYYKVHRAVAAESGEKLAFFNAPNQFNDAALLVRPNGATTIFDANAISASPTAPSELFIGDGTGRQSNVVGSRARNNQISDDIQAVQWDLMGNTAITPLNNTPTGTCDANLPPTTECPASPPKGNDVTVPLFTYTVTMDAIKNGVTPSAVPVRGTVTGYDQGVNARVARTPIRQLAQPEHVQPVAGTDPVQYAGVPNHKGAEVRSAEQTPNGGTLSFVTNVDVSDETTFPSNEYVRALARISDAYGNVSGVTATAPVLKDLVQPNFTQISLVDTDGDGVAEENEVYRVQFDEPMDKTDITSANVNTQLTVVDPAVTGGTCGTGANALTPCVNWGQSPAVTWSDDQRLLSIKLGAPCTQVTTTCRAVTKLPQTGYVVTATSTVTDRNENALQNLSKTIAQPSVLAIAARTADRAGENLYSTNRDGVLDAIDLEFSGPLNPATITAASNAGNFQVTNAGTTLTATGTPVEGANDTVRLAITFPESFTAAQRAAWRTGALPVVTLKNTTGTSDTKLETASGNAIVAFSNFGTTDAAPPAPIAAKTQDVDADGKIDNVYVTFSENIQHAKTNPCGYWVNNPSYGDASYRPTGFATVPSSAKCPDTTVTTERNKPSAVPAGATASDTVALAVPELTLFDTNVRPTVNFNSANRVPNFAPNATADSCYGTIHPATGASTPDCPVVDAAGNKLATFSGVVADGAGPAIVERTTADVNSDGRLDEVRVKYSEPLSTPSIANALFTITDPSFTILPPLGHPSSTELVLKLENAGQRDGNTGVTPKLKAHGGTTDTADPPAATPADEGVVVTDKAAPVIMGACASSPAGTNGTCPVDDAANDKVAIFFSEGVAAGSVALTDFVVEQPAGTAKTATAFAMEDSDKRVVLTFAQGAIDSAADGVVRFASGGSANGVQDKAAAPNTSTQTSNVPMYKAPAVTLNVTCPTPANEGYCMANTVNTGATGSAAVTRWRLMTTPRATSPDDAEFKSSVPAVYPESGVLPEGELKLYLSGKDDFGRLSPEVLGTITILKAPQIKDLQFSNSTASTRGTRTFSKDDTVMDGDSIKIGADAYGTDAAKWAANDAPTGGGCLAQHMSIDIRSLTGSSTAGAVPPSQCNLLTTTEQPYREMLFPTVKATGTTKYPIGTVLKMTDTSPGSLVVDGPNGLARRDFISVNARRSWAITDASVIKVSPTAISALPKVGTVGYRDGAVLKSSTGYYYVERGVKRPVSTYRLSLWRISTARAYSTTSTELRQMPTGKAIGGQSHAIGTWIRYADGRTYQITRNAQGATVRRQLAAGSALRTLVPSTQVYAANSYDSRIPVDTTWLRGYRDGTLLKFSNGTFGVVARGVLRRFASPEAFNTLGYNASNALTANGAAMPRVPGQTYSTGTSIDRYSLGEVVIKVTNKAGASVTLEVPNAAGLYGVGTLHPIPDGWDTTR